MDEVEQVRHCRPQTLDANGVDAPDRLDHGVGRVTALAGVQQAGEGALVVRVLVDVWDAKLGLSQERVIGALENLTLLRDGAHRHFE